MSAKRKKRTKKAKASLQKALYKKHENELRIKFYLKVKEVLEVFNAAEILSFTPKSELDLLFPMRFRPHRITTANGIRINDPLSRSLQKIITDRLKNTNFQIEGTARTFTLMEYFTVFLTLKHWIRTMNAKRFPQKEFFLRTMQPLLDFCGAPNNPEVDFLSFLEAFTHMYCGLTDQWIICLKQDVYSISSPHPEVRHHVEIHVRKIEKIKIKLNGANRTIFQLLSMSGNLDQLKIRAGLICRNCADPDTLLQIYYQKHVLHRAVERLDGFEKGWIKGEIENAIKEPHCKPFGKDRALLTLSITDKRVGYLVIQRIDQVALIRTFLFLTNDGTPEGNLLRKNLGLNKLDKSYIKLDKLSTFMLSDVRDDHVLQKILIDSGCEDLVTFDPRLKDILTLSKASTDAAFIKNYLQLNAREQDESEMSWDEILETELENEMEEDA